MTRDDEEQLRCWSREHARRNTFLSNESVLAIVAGFLLLVLVVLLVVSHVAASPGGVRA